jgi:hypothetical protein
MQFSKCIYYVTLYYNNFKGYIILPLKRKRTRRISDKRKGVNLQLCSLIRTWIIGLWIHDDNTFWGVSPNGNLTKYVDSKIYLAKQNRVGRNWKAERSTHLTNSRWEQEAQNGNSSSSYIHILWTCGFQPKLPPIQLVIQQSVTLPSSCFNSIPTWRKWTEGWVYCYSKHVVFWEFLSGQWFHSPGMPSILFLLLTPGDCKLK